MVQLVAIDLSHLIVFNVLAPAQVAIEYEVKSFTAGRENKTIYQGLSDDVDRAWGELYNRTSRFGLPIRVLRLNNPVADTIMKIPRSEAVLLPNKTYPIKDDPGYYIAELDVFHQLHCLVSSIVCHKKKSCNKYNHMIPKNNIRRALHREYYANDTDLDEDHVSHCVDAIRQSLM